MFKTLKQSRSNDGLQALARAALSYCAMIDSYYLPCLWYVLCANTRTNPQVNETLTVYKGTFGGKTVVFASAGVGTVFAATTATVLVAKFGCEAVLFTGVAGGLLEGQHVGDIVLATDCVNYDMDVTAFVPFPGCKFERGQVRTRTSVVLCSCIRIFLKQKKLFFFFGVSFKHNESRIQSFLDFILLIFILNIFCPFYLRLATVHQLAGVSCRPTLVAIGASGSATRGLQSSGHHCIREEPRNLMMLLSCF